MNNLSLIIPLYNSAPFLPALFENLRQQSIADDMEFVFIDDHGSDDSLQVARALASQYRLNCVFGTTEENGGPGMARNAGIALAKGEYIAFADADDALDPRFCEKLYDAAWTANADLAYCHIQAIEGSRKSVWRNPIVQSGDFTREKKLFFLRYYKSYFTSFIYRRDMILREGISFPPKRSAEDSCFLTEALLCTRTIAVVDEPLYKYQIRPDSLSQAKDSGRYIQRMESFDALLEFAREKGIYETDKEILDYIYIKKATLGAIRNRPVAKAKILAHTGDQIPGWRKNALYRSDWRLRLALLVL